MRWSYGVTTVHHRRHTLLPKTLASLANGGFDRPRLFVDGCRDPLEWEKQFNLEVKGHWPYIRTYGNWILSAWELYIRNPLSDMFAIFQDDLICVKNLRQYLERCRYPRGGYLNLYTFPDNQSLVPFREGKYLNGLWPSNQLGYGAVGLVFNREALSTLLAHRHTVERLVAAHRSFSSVDGCVVTALSDRHLGPPGWKEYIHSPSLLQHTGEQSTMGHGKQALAQTFPGEDFDALSLPLSVPNVQLR